MIFIKNDGRNRMQQNKVRPSLLIGDYGEININKAALEVLGFPAPKTKFSFGVDPENCSAYLAIDETTGFISRETPSGSIRIKNKQAVIRFLQALDAPTDKSLILYFTGDVIELESGKYFKLEKQ